MGLQGRRDVHRTADAEEPVKTLPRHPSSWDDAARVARATQQHGGTVVFSNGVFDLLHPGHIRYLAEARMLGSVLIVAINSDASVRANKGPDRPLTPQGERAEVLLALSSVDVVVVFEEPTPDAVITAIQPDILVKGEDWAADAIVGRDTVEGRGGKVVRLPLEAGLSTSELIRRVRSR
jgi:D-beta-D-heptose 7-phosphate kinase/D-beta-D-heptose 1-phosphate adenosyltransferase